MMAALRLMAPLGVLMRDSMVSGFIAGCIILLGACSQPPDPAQKVSIKATTYPSPFAPSALALPVIRPVAPDISIEQRRLATIPEDEIIQRVLFGPDGRNVACVVKVGWKEQVLINDLKGPEFDEIGDMIWNPQGGTLAYTGTNDVYNSFLFLNGEMIGNYGGVRGPRFSPDGKSFVYTARIGKRWFVILNGKRIADWDYAEGPIFSPDGGRLAYVAEHEGRWLVVFGDKRLPSYDFVVDSSLVFSPDGSRVAYIAWNGDKKFVVVNDQPGEAFYQVGGPLFSTDGRLAYLVVLGATTKYRSMVVVDGKKQEEFEDILDTDIVWGPHGKIAYLATDRLVRYLVVGDRKKVIGFPDGKGFTGASHLTSSPDGKRIAYAAKRGYDKDHMGPVYDSSGKLKGYRRGEGSKSFVVIDDSIGPEFDHVGPPIFSPDGRAVAYTVFDAEKTFVIAGDKRSDNVDVAWDPVFSRDGKKVGFGALKGRELWWMVLGLD